MEYAPAASTLHVSANGIRILSLALDLAASLELGIVVEQWGDDVAGGDPSQHRANLVAAMSDSGLSVTGIAVDLSAAAEFVDLAGSVVAWRPGN
jgi:hypothetical protein